MAKTGRHTTSRRSSQSMYVDGNTVRKVQEVPVKREYRQPEHSVRKKQARPALGPGQELTRQGKSLSREARRNRAKANSMNRNFAIFLGVLGVIVVFQLSASENRMHKQKKPGGFLRIPVSRAEGR